MRKQVSTAFKQLAKGLLLAVPPNLSRSFIRPDKAGLLQVEKSIRENYLTGWRSESRYSKEGFDKELKKQLYGRLETHRTEIIPWLDNAAPLAGKQVLEIGCGTGASTVALAEQGALTTGIDIDEAALAVARERTRVYGVHADLRKLNAQDISSTFRSAKFDFIIFFASLEHMTIPERLSSLQDAWGILPENGFLVIARTPNRLWYFDNHTSFLPFFHWLPDDLAFEYSRFSPRENFRELYAGHDSLPHEHFLRRGRGMSFHEFDVAIGQTRSLKIVSSLSTFRRMIHMLRISQRDRQYKAFLRGVYPDLHEGFLDENLNLIIKKKV